LRVGAPRLDFALRLVPSTINLRGGSAAVTVFALRRDGFTNEIVLALKDAPAGFTLGGGKIPVGQDQVKATITGPAVPSDEHFCLELEGRGMIGGAPVFRPVVPADDLMQAFFYRHLVPAQELAVTVAGRFGQRGAIKILSPLPLVLSPNGTTRVKVGAPRGPFMDRVQFELSDAPEGISLRSATPIREGMELVLQSDAAKLKPDAEGNLIVNAFLPRAAAGTGKGKAAGNRQRKEIGSLPAIPFRVGAGAAGGRPSL